jgi:hypothetical protein
LPAREREQNMAALIREMDPAYREIVQEYFRRINAQAANNP